MKVKTSWLVFPIIASLLLILCTIYLLSYFQVKSTTEGYSYKEKFFNEDEVGKVEIEVTEEDWASLLENPTAEEYIEAKVTINGMEFEHVGVRTKGNSSLSSVANSESERYSLKLDFSQYNSAQTFYGLEKINLNNNFSDTTQMKEFISYELMEQMGIATPAHSYTNVYVNGEKYGLVLAVEEIGEAFLKTNYGTTEGYLFKPESTGSDLKYVSDDKEDYNELFSEAKVNKETAKNNSTIIQMMKEIAQGDTSSLNVDKIASYFALNTALVNMDSYQGSFKHNYYLYEDEDGIFSIIPWDYNMSFGGFTGMGIGNGREMAQNMGQQKEGKKEGNNGLMIGSNMMTDSNINFSITEPVSGTTVDARPLLKIILEDEEARMIYDSALEKIATTVLTEENISSITSKLQALLLDSVDADPTKFATTEQFLEGVAGENSLAAFARMRSESILKQLNGEIEGISGASSMESPNMGGEMPKGFTPPNMGGEMPEGFTPSNIGGEMPGGFTPPNASNQPQTGDNQTNINGTPPNGQVRDPFGNKNMGDIQDNNNKSNAIDKGTSKVAYLIIAASASLLLLVIGFVLLLSNKKYRRK